MITFTLNGKQVQAEEGATILDVAKQNNTYIPTLCHHEALEPAGLCRLCTVELYDGRRTRFVTACNYPVWEGMDVKTDTENVIRHRKMIVELLLGRCPNNAFVQGLAAEFGVEAPRFKLKDDDCILCGLCARMCSERMGIGALSISGRGLDTKIETPFQIKSDVCQACGACESVCPTGHIDLRNITKHEPRPLLSEWDVGLSERTPIYIPFPQAVPLSAVIDPTACAHILTGNCGICQEFCEAGAIDFDQEEEIIEIEVGSVILATGYDVMDPGPIKQYGYGKYPNVYTSLEFERLSNATGPTGGNIVIRDENGEFTRTPQSAAILYCVGSRDVNYHEYCSRVCCMYALKYGHLIKEKVGHNTKVYNFYVDMRCYGKGYEEFYRRCQDEGIMFLRGKPSEITHKALNAEEEGKLVVIGEDTLLNMPYRLPVDMVVLCTAIEARHDTNELAKIFGITQGADGFFSERHNKIAPMKTAVEGIFLAGACQTPKDIPDTVAQASGAAAQSLALAIRGKVEIPYTIAWIDPEMCEGCLACIKLCNYSAIEFDELRGVSMVNQAVCKGCGICASNCPNNAAHVWQYRENRILTEFDDIIEGLQAVGT
ncbi:2Fe-2S iron-sulfur cluster-binding protein [Thermodesulfobacteriota bacterium]